MGQRFVPLFSLGLSVVVWFGVVVAFGSFTSRAAAAITHAELETLKAHFHAEYDRELMVKNQSFIINRPPNPKMKDFWWNQKLPRASYGSYTNKATLHREHYIFFFGGYAAIPELTIDAAILTICHELGHGLGGPPYKDHQPNEDPISIEAVADDYATRVCAKRMFRRIPLATSAGPVTTANADPAMNRRICEAKANRVDFDVCLRTLSAVDFDRHYFRTNPHILEESSLLGADPTVVEFVVTNPAYYPPSQCRIDTMLAGLFGEARPACWWPLEASK